MGEFMLRSMTGFGRATFLTERGKLVVEIQSLNRKFLDLSIFFPKEFSRFEVDIKKVISDQIFRGQVSVRMDIFPEEEQFFSFLPDISFLKSLKKGWEGIAKELNFDPKEIDLKFLIEESKALSNINVLKDDAIKKWKNILVNCIEKALDDLIKMKVQEGLNLKNDLDERILKIEKILAEIEKRAPELPKQYRVKLQKKIEELFAANADIEERLVKEVAFFAERCDITEEIVRVKSHLLQFKKLLDSSEIEKGRRFDFLAQEMGREVNTIAAKSPDVAIGEGVIELKSELEKIKEQIQNIE